MIIRKAEKSLEGIESILWQKSCSDGIFFLLFSFEVIDMKSNANVIALKFMHMETSPGQSQNKWSVWKQNVDAME